MHRGGCRRRLPRFRRALAADSPRLQRRTPPGGFLRDLDQSSKNAAVRSEDGAEHIERPSLWKRPGNAGLKGATRDDVVKFGEAVLWVRAPPGQSVASGPVASLAATSATGRLMRRWASEWAAASQSRNEEVPALKGSEARKAGAPETIRRAEGEQAGRLTAARSKRMVQ